MADKEHKTVADAHRSFETMADVNKQAAALTKLRGLARATREKPVRATVKANFAGLSSVEDQEVALIIILNREVLTAATAGAYKLQRLRAQFDEALDGQVQLLNRGIDKRPEAFVAEAWTRFEDQYSQSGEATSAH